MRGVEGSEQEPELAQQPAVEQVQQPTVEQIPTSTRIRSPYSEVYEQEFLKAHPEEEAAADVIFEDLDNQILNSYESYRSEAYPGVAFSHTALRVTPELIKKIRATDPDSTPLPEVNLKPSTSKDQKWFLFTAFSLPPGGDALTVGDLGIDRFIRLLPTVARAVKAGEVAPNTEINLMGSPTGFGGEVTQEWIDAIKTEGFDAYGKLYSEYVKKHVPEDPAKLDNTRIVLQGVSKGTIVADKTFAHLTPEIQKHTQELIDNPAGNHKAIPLIKYFSGLKVFSGLIGETAVRLAGDPIMKDLMKRDKAFYKAVSEQKGIAPDSPEQTKLKKGAVIHEGLRLLSGTPLDTENNRMFVRRSITDPLTFNPARLGQVYAETGRQIETISQKLAKQEDEFRRQELLDLQAEAERTGMSNEELKARAETLLDRPDYYQKELEESGEDFPKEKARQAISASQHGRALEVGIKAKGHFFSLYRGWGENKGIWKQRIDYVKSPPTSVTQKP